MNEKGLDKIKCRLCNRENLGNTHYCPNCGNNLSNSIESTDILFFVSNFFKILTVFFSFICFNFIVFIEFFRGFDKESFIIGKREYILFLFFCIILFMISYFIKKYTIKLCKGNLSKNNGGNNGED